MIQYPSPDGRFAFLLTRTPEGRKTVDLIEKDSGKIYIGLFNRKTTSVIESMPMRLGHQTQRNSRSAIRLTVVVRRLRCFHDPATCFIKSNCRNFREYNFQPIVARETLPTSMIRTRYVGRKMAH